MRQRHAAGQPLSVVDYVRDGKADREHGYRPLREEGYAGRVVLLGDESAIPFGRPPLSKTYLMGREDLKNWYVKPRDWYEANDVELMTGLRVEAIDIRAREVTMSGGGTLNYDGLLLATGGRNRRLPLHGADLDGI